MCVHVGAGTNISTLEEGKAKHTMPHCPSLHLRRLPVIRFPIRPPSLLSQLHSSSSETKALIENQDSGKTQISLPLSSTSAAQQELG